MKMLRDRVERRAFSPAIFRLTVVLALLAFVSAVPANAAADPQPEPQKSAEPAKEASQPKGVAGELVQETREAAGEDAEENANLKHARPIRWLAGKIDWSVHGTHLLLSGLNFAIVAIVIIWAARKFIPGILQSRNFSIQQALQEARTASQDANRRLADIETRLRQLDVEIGRMQATAENEAAAEEGRIQKAAEEDIRKVALAAKQEIDAAAKQARRELTTHTAGLAIALARQQISVDSNTDQVLVRSFTSKLASPAMTHDNDDHSGKDGR
jgi:F-type H+-transporting ATPase subunit b